VLPGVGAFSCKFSIKGGFNHFRLSQCMLLAQRRSSLSDLLFGAEVAASYFCRLAEVQRS